MSFIDDVIGKISPQWGYKREVWRQAMDEARSYYDAGGYGRTNSNWRATNQSAELTDRYDRDTIRARARDLERNSDILQSVLIAFKRNVIGGGYTLKPKTEDAKINTEIANAWKKWCKSRNCDVTKTQSFQQMLRMAVERKRVDGGILFVKRFTDTGFIPFQIQLIEVDELDVSQTTPKIPGNKVIGGIEYTGFNEPVGYYISQYSIDGFITQKPIYLEGKDVIFYFSKKRPSQLREISDLTHTVPRIRDVNEFMVAVSVKERIAACLSVFIKKMLPSNTGFGREGSAAPASVKSYEGKTVSPGMIKELNAGDEIQVVNPSGQATDATDFTKLQQRLIGAGQGLSYEATSRDMSQSNYSSARQSIIEDGLTYSEEKELLINVMDEIYETFVISCVLKNVVNIKDFWNNKEKYLDHEWIQAPKPWIDPAKESNATKNALASGQKTFQQVAAENGKDWRQQVDDMAEAIEYGHSKGIELGGVIYGREIETEDSK